MSVTLTSQDRALIALRDAVQYAYMAAEFKRQPLLVQQSIRAFLHNLTCYLDGGSR